MNVRHPLVIALFVTALTACARPAGAGPREPASIAPADTAAADPAMARVSAILVNHFGISPKAVTVRARLSEDLGMDELDVIVFVMEAEEEFGFEVPDEVLERIRTVGDLAGFLRSRQ